MSRPSFHEPARPHPTPLTVAKVSPLDDEALDYAVHGRPLVVQGFKGRAPLPLLSRTQAAKVLHSLRAVLLKQLKDDPASYKKH